MSKEKQARPASGKQVPPARRESGRLVTPESLVKEARRVRLAIVARLAREGKQDRKAARETQAQLEALGTQDPQVQQEIKALADLAARLDKQVPPAQQEQMALLEILDPQE